MATIEKRISDGGKIRYRALVRLKGSPVQSATFDRKTDAAKWASKIETEIREGRHFPTSFAKRHTVKDLIDRYLDEVLPRRPDITKEGQLKWWRSELGSRTLADTTVDVVASARDRLLKKEYGKKSPRRVAPTTANRYVAALSSVLTIAMKEWRWVSSNPVRDLPDLPEPAGRVRALDDDELGKLLTACRRSSNSYLHPIVLLALSIGARKSNILGLRWSNVDLERGLMFFERTKRGTAHRVPLRGQALAALTELQKSRDEECLFVFPNQDGKKPIDIRTAWETAVKRAGIKDFTFHDLRHSCATFLAHNGASLHEIAEVLDHRSLEMTRRYTHLTDTRVGEVVQRMNAKVLGD